MRAFPGATTALAGVVLLTACGSVEPPASPPQVTTVPGLATDAFVGALRQAGPDARVAEVMAATAFPFMSTVAVRISAEGENVYAFEFPDTQTAEAQAARVSADGYKIGLAQVEWIAAPHFYRSGPLLVLYVGSSPALLDPLRALLGPPFAGL